MYIQVCNCHLNSGSKQRNYEKRIVNLEKVIFESNSLGKYDLTFIAGDLNFRVNRSI